MLFIAVLPSWLLIALVVFAAFKLVTSLPKLALQKTYSVMQSIFFITMATLAVSILALYFTYEYSISSPACWLGLYGRYISYAALVIEGFIFLYWSLRQPSPFSAILSTHKPFIYAVAMSNAIALIIFWRSLLRCTF